MEEDLVKYYCQSPVVLIVFNRPDKTEILLDQLRKVQPSKLYVIADGPRSHKKDDLTNIESVRKLINDKVNWPCDIHRIYASDNLSGPIRVPSGLDEVFSKEQRAIIIEDDCIPSISFFKFCDELLERYEQDRRVGTICGFNLEFDFLGRPLEGKRPYSYFYSRYPASWGWATWKRVWDNFDPELKDYPDMLKNDFFRNLSPYPSVRRFWNNWFKKYYYKKRNNWDYKLIYSLIKNNQLSIIPNFTLIKNVGTDGTGANYTQKRDYLSQKVSHQLGFPLEHPEILVPDFRYDKNVSLHIYTTNKLLKGLRYIRTYLSRYR